MPHICHITTSHLPKDTRIFQRQCRGLVSRGYRVTLLATTPVEEEVDGVRILPLPRVGRLGRKFILPRLAASMALSLKADLYHFHDPELIPWMSILARRHGAKVVWDAHELYPDAISEFNFRLFPPVAWGVAILFNFFEREWMKPMAGVVAVTDPIRSRYDKDGPPTITIRNVIDLDRLPPVTASPSSTDFTILVSGTTNESRRISRLIEAFAQVVAQAPQARLRLLTHFDSEEARQDIFANIKRLGVQDKISIAPLVSWEELLGKEVSSAHLGVVFYARTKNNLVALPNRLFEYWARGLPVVATDTPILRSLVGSWGAGLLVDSDSSAAIAKGILHYIEHPEDARRAGVNGRRAVTEEFNWGKELSKLSSFYERILRNA